MSEDDYIRAGEFSRFVTSLQGQMAQGFDRTSQEISEVKKDCVDRINTLDSVTQEHGEQLAVLKDRSSRAKRTASGWGAGVGAAVSTALLILHQFFYGK